MAEVLAKGSFLSPCGGGSQRSLLRRCERRKPAFVAFRRGSTPEIGAFRSSVRNSAINGRRLVAGERRRKPLRAYRSLIPIMMSISIGNSSKWWEKGLQPNMKTIESAQDLVGSLLSAGNKLVIVDFFSPGCGGCRALHPKICQLAEMNPDVLFLQVNYEKHKSMCYSLNVHVLPFFRFYRGSDGRLCSFSCTNATIKKFKDALAKNNTEMCSHGPAKGLEESELLALAANKDLSFNYTRKPALVPSHDDVVEIEAPASPRLPLPMATVLIQDSEDKALVASGR